MRGEWTLDQVKTESDRLFKVAQEAFVRSLLPAKPNFKAAERLLMQIVEEILSEKPKEVCGD